MISCFYQAFNNRDAERMIECYHPDIHFKDPVFGDLYGEEARQMWRMLLSRPENIHQIILHQVTENTAQWEAHYIYGQEKRKVINHITARFIIEDGLIRQHIDHFDLWRWSWQALGPAGLLLGWTSFLKDKIRARARRSLKKYK